MLKKARKIFIRSQRKNSYVKNQEWSEVIGKNTLTMLATVESRHIIITKHLSETVITNI